MARGGSPWRQAQRRRLVPVRPESLRWGGLREPVRGVLPVASPNPPLRARPPGGKNRRAAHLTTLLSTPLARNARRRPRLQAPVLQSRCSPGGGTCWIFGTAPPACILSPTHRPRLPPASAAADAGGQALSAPPRRPRGRGAFLRAESGGRPPPLGALPPRALSRGAAHRTIHPPAGWQLFRWGKSAASAARMNLKGSKPLAASSIRLMSRPKPVTKAEPVSKVRSHSLASLLPLLSSTWLPPEPSLNRPVSHHLFLINGPVSHHLFLINRPVSRPRSWA